MRNRINLLGVLGIIAGISYFSLQPMHGSGTGGGTVLLALAFHLGAYFLLAGSLTACFQDTSLGHLETVTIALFFGALMEVGQLHVPTRAFSWTDIALDTAGASVVLLDHRIGAVTRLVSLEDRIIEKLLTA